MRAAAKTAKQHNAAARGFSLVELAIAMFIFALIISSILGPAADLYQKRKNNDAILYLDRASRAIINYALHNRTAYREITYGGNPAIIPPGRPYLPCPDTDGDGIENRIAIPAVIAIAGAANNAGTCTSAKGTIPWRTLQLLPDVDPWGNFLTYHVDASYSNALFGFDETTRADRHDTTRVVAAGGNYAAKPTATSPFIVCDKPLLAAIPCPFANNNNIIAGVFYAMAPAPAPINVAPYQYTAGNFPNGIVKGVAFLVMSHGNNGRFARSRSGNTCNGTVANIAAINTHERRNGFVACNGTFPAGESQQYYFSYPISNTPETGEFDDILRWTMADEIMGALNDAGKTRENEAEAKTPLPIGKLLFLP
ncbi:MAG: type II secretion system protein [Gammaproteobacteria bacterium]